MNILVIGSGGREHAIIKKLRESSKSGRIFCIPGNAGTAVDAENVNIDTKDHDGLIKFAKDKSIDLTVVGPENPLTDGIVDSFRKSGLTVFGPTKAAAELEASKAFSKELMRKYHIPTADYRIFKNAEEAVEHLRSSKHPIVVKASGLAVGKGAKVCMTLEESLEAVSSIMSDRCFGSAGDEVVIEEFMAGEEASVFAVTDGKYYRIFAPAQDHKAVFDGDRGPNTGGMGSYAPAPVITPVLMKEIEDKIIAPTFEAMRKEGRPYTGVLFAGLMITPDGPKVIEYNCRFGDPETQVVLPLFDGDLTDLLYKASAGGFDSNGLLPVKNEYCLCLVLASGGYPGKYQTGYEIKGLEKASYADIIHAGTKLSDGKIVTAGGRVLNLVSSEPSLIEAKERAYRAASEIEFSDKYCRTDIGDKGIRNLKN
ncbi:MAG TPA: phosphoribosylamine--glycine ligase [Clostridiales bacterium]|nr:phosphoribosylamine--glycine ligase [Clostridiales bacterium]